MLRSCKYCGRIHDSKYQCSSRPVRRKIRTKQNSFRSTEAWKRKSLEIRERDKYLCQICMRKLYGTTQQYNNREIEVHHIVPIAEDWDGRLDNDNLISLCGKCLLLSAIKTYMDEILVNGLIEDYSIEFDVEKIRKYVIENEKIKKEDAEAMSDEEMQKQYTDEKVYFKATVTISDVMEDIYLDITA